MGAERLSTAYAAVATGQIPDLPGRETLDSDRRLENVERIAARAQPFKTPDSPKAPKCCIVSSPEPTGSANHPAPRAGGGMSWASNSRSIASVTPTWAVRRRAAP
ncbi:MAG: hypothetical protein AAF899_06055, partial [Pseudomonadota bacterium]